MKNLFLKKIKGKKKGTPERILARREKAFQLRVDEGMTYPQIAAILDISPATVRDDLMIVAKMKYQGMIEKDELLLLESNATLDKVIERWRNLALSQDLIVGETRERKNGELYDITIPTWEACGTATDKLLKAMELKAKINGLTAPKPTKTEEEIGKNVATAVYEAFRALSKQPIQAEVVDTTFEQKQLT